MKKMIVCSLVAALVGYGALAVASNTTKLPSLAEEDLETSIKQRIERAQQTFSGLVKKTDRGLMLETKSGKYQLKG